MTTYFFDWMFYKVSTKVLVNRLQKYAKVSFLVGISKLCNVLNGQMAMDYARKTHQELIIVQLEKAYDHINWSFVF